MQSSRADPVAVLRWPDERVEVERVRAARIPRLLVVAPGREPPTSDDPLEDWVRQPVDEEDLRHRITVLGRRFAAEARPWLDGNGRLLFNSAWIALSDIDERILGVLVRHFEQFVDGGDLLAAGWEGVATQNALKLHVYRLRRRLKPLGLEIERSRGRGRLMLHAPRRSPVESIGHP